MSPRQKPIYNVVLSSVRIEGDKAILIIEIRDSTGATIYSVQKIMELNKFTRMTSGELKKLLKQVYSKVKPAIELSGTKVVVEQ